MANKLRSKFFRVAVEGDTIDGREITRQQIVDMAETYDTRVYGARIWPEHFRGLIPGGPFDALGDVVALKAEAIKEGSVLDGKMGLYAQVDALPSLVDLNNTGQKIFHSIEVATNFGKSNKAYCVGLAVTDTPASKGTQVLAFGATSGEVFAGMSHEGKLEFATGESTEEDGAWKPTFFSRVKEMLGKNKGETTQRFGDIERAVEEVATFAQGLEKRIDQGSRNYVPRSEFDALEAANEALYADLKALREQLNLTAAPGSTARTPATGGDGQKLAEY